MVRISRFLQRHFIEHVELRTDLTRAFRAVTAFSIPLVVFHWLKQPAEAVFISTAAMNLSLPDLRGAYRVRLGILLAMILLAASSAFLGVACAGHSVAAVLTMGCLALLGGVWRHLSADYGPSMAVSSALLFLLGLSQSAGAANGMHLAGLTALGGLLATLLHGCVWLFRPQHALRYAVAETWVAASDLIAAMRPGNAPDPAARNPSVAAKEGELRAALDRTFVILNGAENRPQAALVNRLEEMRREVVHLTMRVIAFNSSLETLWNQPEFTHCLPALDSVMKALSDAARSVAISLIMHRAENLAASGVRLRRCQHLLAALDAQLALLPPENPAVAQVRDALARIGNTFPHVQAALAETGDHTLPRLTIAASLPDFSTYSMRALGSWMRPAARPDLVLIRHSVRMAVFTMLAVALYEGFDIARGYWIAFTIVVVLQPDYGSTRQRAGARIAGTLGGAVLATALLWLKVPWFLLDDLAVATAFAFAYCLKSNYGLAISFVTLNLMLITETMSPVNVNFMIIRALATLAGGVLALVAARVFWPAWEGEKFPSLLAAAARSNRNFLMSLADAFENSPGPAVDLLMARRRAENANRHVAASVGRLQGEPAGISDDPERAAALATYSQRVTRALTVLAVQVPPSGRGSNPAIAAALKPMGEWLERVAHALENHCPAEAVEALNDDLCRLESRLDREGAWTGHNAQWLATPTGLIWAQILKTIAELRAFTQALKM